jgi:trimeric autotransporter adhesin
VGVSGTGTSSGGWTTSSDRRLKTDFSQLGDDLLSKLSSLSAYQYRYIADPTRTQRYGVIAQEVAALFPNAVMNDGGGYLAVDYGAIGAIAAAGVGKLNKQFIALSNTVTEHGTQITALETKLSGVDERVLALEGWRNTATVRMDGMQKAIDLNIAQIAEHALKIAANTDSITKLETLVGKIDERVTSTEGRLDKVEGKWASTFTHSEDGQTLTVNTPNLVATNFTATQLKVKSAYTERLEAEMAKIRQLEVDNLKANTAQARSVQADNVQAATVNTGSAQVYAGAGLPAFLFSAPADGLYTVSTSAMDGSYAMAAVIVNAGQVKVVPLKSEGIELIGEGNSVKAIANGKTIRASWTKTG